MCEHSFNANFYHFSVTQGGKKCLVTINLCAFYEKCLWNVVWVLEYSWYSWGCKCLLPAVTIRCCHVLHLLWSSTLSLTYILCWCFNGIFCSSVDVYYFCLKYILLFHYPPPLTSWLWLHTMQSKEQFCNLVCARGEWLGENSSGDN